MSNIVFNRTKIIATVGPASNTKETLKELIHAGVDIFRLNFSHGTHEAHQTVIDHVRSLNQELGTNITLLQDLQGPKIRINEVAEGTVLTKGNELVLTTQPIQGSDKKVSTSYTLLPHDVKAGNTILIDDGRIELRVKSTNETEVVTEVVHGGPISSRKGMNLPQANVSASSLTEKDKEDLDFGLKNDIDWVALSFVRTAEDISQLRKRIEARGKDTKIIAKIEKPEAVRNINRIIDETDAVMVARGDLGVEIFMEEVPMVQKRIIFKCNKKAKPVIVATQMLESMIENPRPTRAETSDVANSVVDGADAVMLSAESATGKYPILAVKSMVHTITSVETNNILIYYKYKKLDSNSDLFLNDSLIQSAVRLSEETKAKAIVGMTQSGFTAWRLSAHRPQSNIFIFTSNRQLLARINLIWGVRGFYYDAAESTDATIADIEKILKEAGHLNRGDVFITMASMPLHKKQRTNMLKINVVD